MKGKNKYFVALLLTFALMTVALLGVSGVFAEQHVEEQGQDKDLEGINGETIIIQKVDSVYRGPNLKGAKFKVFLKENENADWELLKQEPKVAEDGRIIYFKDNNDDFFPSLDDYYIRIEEVTPPANYSASKPEGEAIIEGIIYGNNSGVESNEVNRSVIFWDHYFVIGNEVNRNDFTVNKVDENGNPLEGAEFVIYGKGEVLLGDVVEEQQQESQQQ